MRPFSKLSPQIWRSARFNGLKSDEAKLLFLYLVSNPHHNNAGCYSLPDGYAQTDLGWSQTKYLNARAILIGAEMIRIDEETSEILIERWFKHNMPMNPLHLKGIRAEIALIRSNAFRETATSAVNDVTPQHLLDKEKLALAAEHRRAGITELPRRGP